MSQEYGTIGLAEGPTSGRPLGECKGEGARSPQVFLLFILLVREYRCWINPYSFSLLRNFMSFFSGKVAGHQVKEEGQENNITGDEIKYLRAKRKSTCYHVGTT